MGSSRLARHLKTLPLTRGYSITSEPLSTIVAAKTADYFPNKCISLTKPNFRKIYCGEMFFKIQLTTLLQYVVAMINSRFIFQHFKGPDDSFQGYLLA